MKTQIIWTGKFYHTIEHCTLIENEEGNEVISTIMGSHQDRLFKVDYQIKTNTVWETEYVNLRIDTDGTKESFVLEKQAGLWLLNGKSNREYNGFKDIDISLTPFTNTLPINRLQLQENEKSVIAVLYFDILGKEIKPVKQVYSKINNEQYTYENFDNSFRAQISIDAQGLVMNYPELFEMTLKKVESCKF